MPDLAPNEYNRPGPVRYTLDRRCGMPPEVHVIARPCLEMIIRKIAAHAYPRFHFLLDQFPSAERTDVVTARIKQVGQIRHVAQRENGYAAIACLRQEAAVNERGIGYVRT